MSKDLVFSLKKSLSVGSLDDLVRAKTSEKIFLLIDCSGSMKERMRNGKRRIDGLRIVVKDVQAEQPDVKLIMFPGEGDGTPHVTGSPHEPHGGTPLAQAIEVARSLEAGRVVVISDGVPDDESQALDSAQRFGGRIDVVFVGNPHEPGEAFLLRLAESTGGTSFTGDLSEMKELASKVLGLLTGEVEEDEEDE